jgi:putative oxidoreductase
MSLISLLGRICFAAIFLMSVPHQFQPETVEYAAKAGVPYAEWLVPASGVLALLGALSVLLGYRARLGAFLLIAFLVPVTIMMHAFWDATDPQQYQLQLVNFAKNAGLLGGALLLFAHGPGGCSFDRRRWRRHHDELDLDDSMTAAV